MNDTEQGKASGRKVYNDLLRFQDSTRKKVYVLASHSHFYMSNVYNTSCRREHPETILPGWIVGTAGAVRYQLPADTSGSGEAQNELYGYLLGEVSTDGTIDFKYRSIPKEVEAIPAPVRKEFTDAFVESCLTGNHSKYQPEGPAKPPNCDCLK